MKNKTTHKLVMSRLASNRWALYKIPLNDRGALMHSLALFLDRDGVYKHAGFNDLIYIWKSKEEIYNALTEEDRAQCVLQSLIFEK